MKKNNKILKYVNLNYKPLKSDLITELYIEPRKGITFNDAAANIALESSIGTWTQVSTFKSYIKRLKPSVFYVNKKTGIIKIAYPLDLFELGNVPQLLSSIAGNIFGMKAVNNLRLLDITFPEKYLKSFKGPKHGIKGVRKKIGVWNRPLVGTIVKPKLGLNEKDHAAVAFKAWSGGCDIVKDDENLSSMTFNNFKKRIKLTLKKKDLAEKITKEKKVYLANVTAPYNEMIKRAKFVKSLGGNFIMVDVLTTGFSALQDLLKETRKLDLVVHGHRAMHAALTRNQKHGISMLTIAKLCRLIGIDQLHIGAIVGKMEGGKKEVQHIGEVIESQIIKEKIKSHVLAQNWRKIKPMFAVCSGGLHPGLTSPLIKYMGKDIIIQMGGGIHGHPKGSFYGARAARQSVDAAMKKIGIKEYAKTHKELKEAIKKFGYKR